MPFKKYAELPVVVTGGAGFIGSHLVRGLVAAGAKVRVLDNFSHGSRDNLADIASQIELIAGDIRNPDDCHQAMTGLAGGVVFHLAALGSVPRSVEEPLLYNDVNVAGTLHILQAARAAQAKRIVYSASSSAYGDTPVLPKNESMRPEPKSPYAVTKLTGEHYIQVYANVYGLEGVSLRYFNVFGPRQNPKSQYAAVIPAWITALLQGKPPLVYGDGQQSRDFCYVENVVQANLLGGITERKLAGEVVNIACGERTTLNDMLGRMRQTIKTNIEAEYLPARQGDVRDSLADITAARTLLGYEPKVFFAEGLQRTITWFMAQSFPE